MLLLVLSLRACINPYKNVYGEREVVVTDKHSYYAGDYETTSYKIFIELDWYDNEDDPFLETHILEVDKETYDNIEIGDTVIVNFYRKYSFKDSELYHVDFVGVS